MLRIAPIGIRTPYAAGPAYVVRFYIDRGQAEIIVSGQRLEDDTLTGTREASDALMPERVT